MQKEQLLREKVKIWDIFFSREQSGLHKGGSKFKGQLEDEKGRENGTKQEPNQILRGYFKGGQDSVQQERAKIGKNTFL